ncbi:MAG: chromate transporter [Burkholderiaceae bacterium]
MPKLKRNAQDRLPLPDRPQPSSKTDLFWSFTWLALQGFGGVLPVVQRELVDRKQWLSREEFIEEWAVAQVLPGPNVVNFALVFGDRYFGLAGGMAALAGLMLFPLMLALTLAALFASIADIPAAQGALRGMGAVTAGLITAAGLKLIPSLKKNVMGQPACISIAVLTFCAIALLRIPLATVLLTLGILSGFWAYRQLGQLGAVRLAKEDQP